MRNPFRTRILPRGVLLTMATSGGAIVLALALLIQLLVWAGWL